MKTISVFVLLLTGLFLTAPLAAQVGRPKSDVANFLTQWADPETVAVWTQGIRAGRGALAQGRLGEAALSFQQAVTVCDRKFSDDIHQCVARLLLAEVLLEAGETEKTKVQIDQIVGSLKKATRSRESREIMAGVIANSFRYQVGGALYLRVVRIYVRLGTPQLAEPLFPLAVQVFGQIVHKKFFYADNGKESPYYPQRELRIAEIYEAQCRFNLVWGRDEQALKSLQEAVLARKTPPVVSQDEEFLDRIVAEPLDKSLLKRFLEDCAFYRFDDGRIADLLVRQAALLRKVGRADEATAFERFAESLRRRPATP